MNSKYEWGDNSSARYYICACIVYILENEARKVI